jgi:MinD superfamily P-loop ATPase
LFLDCDVEEPNAALILEPELGQREDVGILIPEVDLDKCTYCGRCAEVCVWHAINKADVNPAHAAAIEAYCRALAIELTGRLQYDDVVTEAMVHGQPVTAYQPQGSMAAALREVWARVRKRLDGGE